MDTQDAWEKKLQARLDELNAEIARLEAKADLAAADAQLEYRKQLGELRSVRGDAEKRLEELRSAGAAARDDLAAGAEAAWESLSDAVKRSISRFK